VGTSVGTLPRAASSADPIRIPSSPFSFRSAQFENAITGSSESFYDSGTINRTRSCAAHATDFSNCIFAPPRPRHGPHGRHGLSGLRLVGLQRYGTAYSPVSGPSSGPVRSDLHISLLGCGHSTSHSTRLSRSLPSCHFVGVSSEKTTVTRDIGGRATVVM